jgi:hypothetical protein
MAEPIIRPSAATHERLRRERRRELASSAVIASGARSTTMWATVRPVSRP